MTESIESVHQLVQTENVRRIMHVNGERFRPRAHQGNWKPQRNLINLSCTHRSRSFCVVPPYQGNGKENRSLFLTSYAVSEIGRSPESVCFRLRAIVT
jgi:hypothetical protein